MTENRKDADDIDLEDIECPGRKQYWRRVKERKCTRCGDKLPDNYELRQCADCRVKAKEEHKERYERLKSEGRCVRCTDKLSDDYERSDCYCGDCLDEIEESMNSEDNWHKFYRKKILEELENMPDYLEEQFFKGLKDLSGEVENRE